MNYSPVDAVATEAQKLPNFLIIGAEKAGTTSLCAALARHPDIFFSVPKEPHFFSNEENFARGLDWYRRLFEGSADYQVVGEGSVTYSYASRVARVIPRLLETLGPIKIIYAVRHPLKRIASVWRQSQALGGLPQNMQFDEFVYSRPDFLIENSHYEARIAPFREAFGDEQVFEGLFEDFITDQSAFLRRLYSFLDLPPAPADSIVHANRSADRRDRESVRRFRESAPFRVLRGIIPDGVRRAIARQLRVPVRPAVWQGDVLDLVRSRLEAPTARYLERLGKPANFYTFSEERAE